LAVGGAVVGGLLGNQVGSGRGNTVATAMARLAAQSPATKSRNA
jgi:outer membrane lipoprotein SlyB